MGHPDCGEAASPDFMLYQISFIEHLSDTNRIEDR
jgi:hypothetical protein